MWHAADCSLSYSYFGSSGSTLHHNASGATKIIERFSLYTASQLKEKFSLLFHVEHIMTINDFNEYRRLLDARAQASQILSPVDAANKPEINRGYPRFMAGTFEVTCGGLVQVTSTVDTAHWTTHVHAHLPHCCRW
jgi:hypothetical protein